MKDPFQPRNPSAKGGQTMPKTVVREKESIEDALRRFKRDVSKSGVLRDAKDKKFYVKPSVKKKIAQRAARSKNK
jgi:small subunit ribosomal protein S21